MDCLDENTVVAYVEGRLPATEERRLLEHSDTCDTCRRLIAATAHALVPAVSPLDPTEPPEQGNQPLVPGQRLGRYVVRELIGAGGMGVVYEAQDPELDRKVALKLMRTDSVFAAGPELRQRLLREAQAMARVRHANVITIFDVGTIGEQVFFAMELIEGTTLAEWQRGNRSVAEILRVYALAGEGLRAAHAVGVVHRDFKPDNVLVSADGHVCVTDFGLARPTARVETPADAGAAVATVTRATGVVGTPAYMAPEQMRGERADARADQFSFCVALFEALYGVRPFPGRTLDELRAAIHDGRRVQRDRRGVPARVRRLLDRGLQLDPEARFPSMAELLAQLVSHRRAQLGITLGIAAMLALAGFVGWQRLQAGNRAQLCKQAAGKMADAWSPEHQAAVRNVIETASGTEAWQRFKVALDSYAQRWTEMHGQACEATHVRGEQSEALLDLRLDCLDQRYQDVRGLVEVLTSQPQAAPKALKAVTAMRSIDECADVAMLRRRNTAVIEPAKLTPLRQLVSRARAEVFTNNCKQALADAQAATKPAHQLGALVEESDAYYDMGYAQACLGDHVQAQDHFLEAAVVGARAQDDTRMARAYLALLGNSMDEHKLDQAAHWSALCGESLDHVAGDIELRAEHRTSVCILEIYLDHSQEAEKQCREALSLYHKLPTPNPYAEAHAYHMLGVLLGDRGDFAAADANYREAVRLFSESMGPESSDTIQVLMSLAADEMEQDHLEAALALQKRVISVKPDRAWLGDAAEARTFYGRLLVDLGRPNEALPYLLEAAGMIEKMQGASPYHRAVQKRSFGAAYLALGKPAQALPYLQEAWKEMPTDGTDWERSLLAIDLAKALWEVTPQHARALEVATWSRDFMRKNDLGAYRKRKLAELEAWISARQRSR